MSSDEEDSDCPLCMEELDIADRNFRPCPCGYQICRFCWHHIKTNLNGRCPACRRLYSDQIVEFVPVSAEEIMRLKKEKKEKDRQTRDMRDPSRRQLSNVRVVQKNLVYVLGLSVKHASVDNEFFKKYGRIDKVVISKRSAPSSGSNSSVGIYVTFTRKEDAGRAIEGLNGMEYDGKTLRASYGTTKYCTYYLRHMSCPNPNCMYLHEPGDDVDSYSKDTVAIGKHANTSVSSSTSAATASPTYPNKRPATAATALKASTSTSTTPEPKPATVPRTWAPIPKVVPIPPVVIPKEETPVIVAAPTPASPSPPFKEITKPPSIKKAPATVKTSKSTSTSSSKKPAVEKPTKKIIVPLVLEEPVLPATASWAKTQPVVAQHESGVITPANFGPSLSDALNAPQKPKHSPSLKVKKEKKAKGKMVRLKEFEEAEREAKMVAATRPKSFVNVDEAPVVPSVEEQQPGVEVQLVNSIVIEEEAYEQPSFSDAAPVQEKDEEEEFKVEAEAEGEQEPIKPEMVEIKKITAAVEKVQDDAEDELLAFTDNEQDEVMEPLVQIEEEEEEEDSLDDDDEDESDNEKIEDLATLNDDIIKAFDNAAHESCEKVQADIHQQDNISSVEQHDDFINGQQTISSPIAAMDRLSALVQQEIMPETPQVDLQLEPFQGHHPLPHPGMNNNNRFDMSPMQPDHHRSPMPPPPGLNVGVPPPPDWMNRNSSFDPFNGQDPSLIAARRLQHSQRMLEASGLFAGGQFGPPVVPQFGFSPDFNHGHPPPPGFLPPHPHHPHHHQPPPPPPPLGMFAPPPPHPHHPMMRGPPPPPPEMMNMQQQQHSPFGQTIQPMDDLRNKFGAMQMNGEGHHHHQQSRDDFRALLPNVNISFNNLQEKRRAEEFYQQQQLMMRQQQGDIPNQSPLRHHPSFNGSSSLSSPMMAGGGLFQQQPPSQWQQSPGMMNNNPEVVRVEAQNFFGEFLRKAASSTTNEKEEQHQLQQPATSLPFQDPAIMSVRLVDDNETPINEVARSQNTILQILGGQQQPPPPPQLSFEQQHMHQQFLRQQQQQRQMDPRFMMEQGRMMQEGNFHNNNIFMGGPPPNFHHHHHHQQQQPSPFHHQQQPNSFMHPPPNGFGMGRMGTPPGMMRPPPSPLNDMRYGQPLAGMFEEGGHHS